MFDMEPVEQKQLEWNWTCSSLFSPFIDQVLETKIKQGSQDVVLLTEQTHYLKATENKMIKNCLFFYHSKQFTFKTITTEDTTTANNIRLPT